MNDLKFNDDIWSVFRLEHNIMIDKKLQWVIELIFYKGDLSLLSNMDKDWRFKPVENKRKQVILLGICETKFPVKFPLSLYNGLILNNENYYHRYCYDE